MNSPLYIGFDTHGSTFSFLAVAAVSNEPKCFSGGSFGWRWKLEPSQASWNIIRLPLTKPYDVSPLAVLAISSFVLTLLPGSPRYYQAVMGIIGKVYANSMMVLINSRIHLGVEGEQATVVTFLSDIDFEHRCVDTEGTNDADMELPGTRSWGKWFPTKNKHKLNLWSYETSCYIFRQ